MDNMKSPHGDDFKILIQERIKNFFGYGNLESDVWFVGMEEGFDGSMDLLYERFKTTSNKVVCDIVEDMQTSPDHLRWFEDNAPTQKTYRPLIFIQQYLKTGKEPTLEEIRQFQINSFGRKTADHTVLELMPLPSKSIKASDWLYGDFNIKGLGSRREYLKTYKPERVESLQKLIHTHKPKLVLFYSRTYLPDWQQIASVPFAEVIPKKLHIAKDHGTIYAVVPHATSFGMSNEDWRAIAEKIRNALEIVVIV
jgi:hypothetical protein